MKQRVAIGALIVAAWWCAALIASARPGWEIREGNTVVRMPFTGALIDNLLNYGWWAVLAPVIAKTVTWIATSSRSRFSRLLLHALSAIAFILVYFTLRTFVQPAFSHYFTRWSFSSMVSMAPFLIGIYGLIVTITLIVLSNNRIARSEAQLAEARLQALSAQLQPHFLANALNGVAALVETRPEEARRAIAHIGELLRTAVRALQRPAMPLTQEIEWLERYLDVQQIRFDDRIDVVLDVSPDAMNAMVPPLILQPLVENAIKHGVERRSRGASVRVSAQRRNGKLHVLVANNGTLANRHSDEGVGIRNVRDRLQAAFGPNQRLSLEQRGDMVEAVLEIPFSSEDA